MPGPEGRDEEAQRDHQPPTDGNDRPTIAHVGPLEVDIPRAIGYFGAVALAVALEIVEPPVGLFIASVPLFKLLEKRNKREPTRFLGEVLEGAAKPVGGDAESVIRLTPPQRPPENPQG